MKKIILIIALIILMVIGLFCLTGCSSFEEGVRKGLEESLNKNTAQNIIVPQQEENIVQSQNLTVVEEKTNTVQQESDSVVKQNYDTNYEWKCSDDVLQEQNIEIKILAVEIDDYNGIKLEEGTYKFSYTYKEYWDLKNTNKFNRYYHIYVSETLTNSTDNIINDYKHTFSPGAENEYTIELKKGQYVYLEHTANQYAGSGDLKIERIK